MTFPGHRYRLVFCLLIIGCFLPPSTYAVEPVSSPSTTAGEESPELIKNTDAQVEFNKDYFKGYVDDFKNIVTSPSRWDKSEWITAGVISGVAAGLYDNDAKIQKWALDHRTTTINKLGDDVTLLGHGALTVPVVGGMYLFGYLADDPKLRKTSLLSVESFVLTGVFVQALKNGTGRHRPYTNDPPHTWDGPGIHGSAETSFPSGHASSAFAVATVIASEYDNYVVPAFAYSVAAITALNRVWHNAHWPSDTFVGSAIGYFTGKTVVASHRAGGETKMSFAPMIIDGVPGMVLTYVF